MWCSPTMIGGKEQSIARAPNGLATNTVAADNNQLSSVAKIGPMTMNVAKAVTIT